MNILEKVIDFQNLFLELKEMVYDFVGKFETVMGSYYVIEKKRI